jgi:hypothetical protein
VTDFVGRRETYGMSPPGTKCECRLVPLTTALIYKLVKAVFENQPRLLKAHSAASETIPQNADKNIFLPFHPGAVRYYRGIGINIPDPLAPTN